MKNLSALYSIQKFNTLLIVGAFILILGQRNVFAQSGRQTSRADSANNQSLYQDISRPYGEYRYVPQAGIYKDATLSDGVDSLSDGVASVSKAVRNTNFIAGWSQGDPGGGFSYGLGGGVYNFGLPAAYARLGNSYNGSRDGLRMALGPLLVDNFYASYGALYADIQGAYPGRDLLPPDDRWAQIVTLTCRFSIMIGSLAVSIQPFAYWLPDTGKVGWAVPGPLAGIMGYQPNAMALFRMAWSRQVGNWNYTLFDQFSPRISQYNIWDVFANSQPTFGDLTPFERVGRYGVGYGAADTANYSPQARFGLANNQNWNGMTGYYNVVGGRALGTLGPRTRSLFYLYRSDFWDEKFRSLYANLVGGAYIRTGTPDFTTYAGYNFSSVDPFTTYFNWAVVGAVKQLGPSLTGYAQGGYYWTSGANKGAQGLLGTVGLQQRLGQRTTQYAETGRRVYMPITGPYGVENYVDYRIYHLLGSRANISGYVGMSDRYVDTIGNNNVLNFKYAGLIFNAGLTPRLNLVATSGWSHSTSGLSAYNYDSWTHRLGLRHNTTETLQTQCFYQYIESRNNSSSSSYSFSEHYIYIGVTKRF